MSSTYFRSPSFNDPNWRRRKQSLTPNDYLATDEDISKSEIFSQGELIPLTIIGTEANLFPNPPPVRLVVWNEDHHLGITLDQYDVRNLITSTHKLEEIATQGPPKTIVYRLSRSHY
jgi:hypothetical protein